MANINITSDAWTEISITSGTVQNISATADIELSAEQTDNRGVVLKPSEIYQWDNETIYARAVTEDTGALRVVNFKKAAGGGGYVLPVASASTLGGVKVGSNLSIDENGVLSSTGGGAVNYSTTEQQIGTWIDGKPLYQITLQDTMPTITSTSPVDKNIDISNLTLEYLVNCFGYIKRNPSNLLISIDCVTGITPLASFTSAFLRKTDATKEYYNILTLRGNAPDDSEQPVYVTLQYTKTTD